MTSILKADNIQDADGNNIINESGNTITIGASGDTTNVIGTLNKDGVAVANTPSFQAQGNGGQVLSSGSATKITFATEVYDSSSKYDTSTSRFTPGEAGKFFIYANSRFNADNGSGAQQYEIRIYKNGSQQSPTMINGIYDVTAQIITNNVSGIVTSSNTTDYFEIFGYADGTNREVYESRIFGGFNIIE